MTRVTLLAMVCLFSHGLLAQEADSADQSTEQKAEPKTETSRTNQNILGMNVRGNKESPLSLTIVPWRAANHATPDPEVMTGWRPDWQLLQPEAYRRNVRAFLKIRRLSAKSSPE